MKLKVIAALLLLLISCAPEKPAEEILQQQANKLNEVLRECKIKDEYRCESKTITNERCSRKKIQNELYCKSHNVYRPFGRYDEVAIEKEKMININLIDKKLYIESIKFKYDDKSFLIDMNGIIYTIDTCLIVGRQLNDEIIWF